MEKQFSLKDGERIIAKFASFNGKDEGRHFYRYVELVVGCRLEGEVWTFWRKRGCAQQFAFVMEDSSHVTLLRDQPPLLVDTLKPAFDMCKQGDVEGYIILANLFEDLEAEVKKVMTEGRESENGEIQRVCREFLKYKS